MERDIYYGHGKLMLSSEYFVLNGAKTLALPTKLGQSLSVEYRPSNTPKLYWQSLDHMGNIWLDVIFDIWHFDILDKNKENPYALKIQHILRQVRKQNIHFLRDYCDSYVKTNLEFPLEWGIGSSSSLIYNISQWAYISPFELLKNTFGGSGYDIACAQAMGAIIYQIKEGTPSWEKIDFYPRFKDQVYFVYLNEKKSSKKAIEYYHSLDFENKEEISKKLTKITDEILKTQNLDSFEALIKEHETILSTALKLKTVKELRFSDFWGQVKSLGAWGGDFVLVTSHKSLEETKKYFHDKGYHVFLNYDEIIYQGDKMASGQQLSKEVGHYEQFF